MYFLLSMVFLVKGPVGLLLFILTTIGFLLWIRDFQSIRSLWYLPGFLLFLGIICAWGIPFWISLGTKQIFILLSQEMSGGFVSGYAHPFLVHIYRNLFLSFSLEIDDLYPSHFPFHCIANQVILPMGNGRHSEEKVRNDIVACAIRISNDSPVAHFCPAKMGARGTWFIHNAYGHSPYYSFRRDSSITLYLLYE